MTKQTFTSASSRPWQGIGTTVQTVMKVSEALLLGGLDWNVEKRPIFAGDSAGKDSFPTSTPINNHFATVRSDNQSVLGIVGNRYEVVQNVAAFDFFDSAVGEGTACIDTVGSFGGGRKVFMLASIPEVVEPFPGDPIQRFLLFTNSHDGSSCVHVLFTNVRIICQNTLSTAIKTAKRSVSIRHTQGAVGRLKQAHLILAQEEQYWKRLKGAYQYLQRRDVNREDVAKFVTEMFPGKLDKKSGETKVSTITKKRRQAVVKAFETAPGQDLAGTNAWGLFNGLTYWLDHERELSKDSNLWESSVLGSGDKIRQRGFDYLIGL